MNFDSWVDNATEWQLRDYKKVFLLDSERYSDELFKIDRRLAVFDEQNRIRNEKIREEMIKRQREQERLNQIALEGKRKQKEEWLKDPLNEKTKLGWEAMRLSAPNLDGVERFEDLGEAMLYRYGAFTRAVLGKEQEEIVKSKKQLAREEKQADQASRDFYGYGNDYDWDD